MYIVFYNSLTHKGLTGKGFSESYQGGHRPRYNTLAADACYWLPLPKERELVVTKIPPSEPTTGRERELTRD